ncbi:AIPR family protein [Bacillus pseudomycoides]|uniref:AIPR family protein n=1 Tax=Bacillus pseudomycoides TaxID=64104 RepID=UPI000BEB3F6B|nr:AIPR family protein [Bacillus pseudomycoides]PED07211.1 hypothetical protein COO19_16550 [Bacillus pseudomycoides]PEK11480.1 hypothetical protein CN693_26210 [Bacillus pseudomycoides]PEO21571.1 hypothetical protein CN542_10370 [Bacillus pseudomycoides]PEP68282.1 hypothetical protein CN591_09105 [Bacillus pseudomycoides]PFW69206.1 hypothetical protein COL25_08950 [Bacillus pseudomycoides]
MGRLVLTLTRDQINDPQKKVKFYKGKPYTSYKVDVNIRSLRNFKELLDWDEVNPRDPDDKAKPSKAMRKTLATEMDDIFSTLNGGVLLSAESCVFYEDKKTELHMVDIVLTDPSLHGYIDGGHSLDVVMDAENIKADIQHIEFEIVCDIGHELKEKLAETRNTRTQVTQISLADHRGELNPIKEALSSEWYGEHIAYAQNEWGHIKCEKHIVPLITAVNPSLSDAAVRQSYTGTSKCLEHYLGDTEFIFKFKHLLTGLLEFHDYLKENIPATYNYYGYSPEGKPLTPGPGKYKYRALTSIENKPDEILIFTDLTKKSPYVPKGFYLPVIASMRHALKLDDKAEKYQWIVSPKEIYEENKKNINDIIFKYYYLKGQMPNPTGKIKHLWEELDRVVIDHLKGMEDKRQAERLALLEKLALEHGINL